MRICILNYTICNTGLYKYLTSIWATRLFSRHCDICKDFRIEIRVFYNSKSKAVIAT
jgi:hypothetical protein